MRFDCTYFCVIFPFLRLYERLSTNRCGILGFFFALRTDPPGAYWNLRFRLYYIPWVSSWIFEVLSSAAADAAYLGCSFAVLAESLGSAGFSHFIKHAHWCVIAKNSFTIEDPTTLLAFSGRPTSVCHAIIPSDTYVLTHQPPWSVSSPRAILKISSAFHHRLFFVLNAGAS